MVEDVATKVKRKNGRPLGSQNTTKAITFIALMTCDEALALAHKLDRHGITRCNYNILYKFMNTMKADGEDTIKMKVVMETLNCLVHYGLMKLDGIEDKKPVFARNYDEG